MGGEGSGRKPDVIKMMREQQQTPIITGGSSSDFFIPNYSGIKKEALKTDPTNLATGGVSGVASFNTRTGAVTAASNDYTWAQINKATSDINDITTKSHTSLSDIGTNTHAAIDTHIADTSDPHGAVLQQSQINFITASGSGIIATGTFSGAAIVLTSGATTTADLTTSGFSTFRGILIGTETSPPTASTYSQGTIWLKYTP